MYSEIIKQAAIAAGMGYLLYDFIPAPKTRKFHHNILKKCYGATMPIGFRKWFRYYLSMGKGHHLLVAGETGSGKSMWLKTAVYTCIKKKIPFYLIDLKLGVEFGEFRPWSHGLAIDTQEAVEMLEMLKGVMEKRYELFAKNGVRDIDKYVKKTGRPLSRLMIFFDEYGRFTHDGIKEAESMGADWKGERARRITGQMLTVLLAQQARAAGIHLIIACQYPIKELISGALKINLTTRLIFKVGSKTQSEVCLDSSEAADLSGEPGEAIYKFRMLKVKVQTYNLTDEKLEEYLSQIPIPKRKAPPRKPKKIL